MTPYLQILLKLSSIETFTIQSYFKRIYMESLEHNNAHFSLPICTNRLILARYANRSHNFTNLVFFTSSLLFSIVVSYSLLCFMCYRSKSDFTAESSHKLYLKSNSVGVINSSSGTLYTTTTIKVWRPYITKSVKQLILALFLHNILRGRRFPPSTMNLTPDFFHGKQKYTRTPVARTWITRTKSYFPWGSPHFSVIFTRITRTQICNTRLKWEKMLCRNTQCQVLGKLGEQIRVPVCKSAQILRRRPNGAEFKLGVPCSPVITVLTFLVKKVQWSFPMCRFFLTGEKLELISINFFKSRLRIWRSLLVSL